jgi:uncharacterized protein YndB with AHSA1/START domain
MTKEVKSELEMHVDVDAPIEAVWKALTEAEGLANWFSPIAKVSAPGLNGEVTSAWSEEMAFTVRVDAWEPHRHVRWISEDMMGPGTALTTDFHLETAGGKTRVRLVQSGFGEFEGWDDFFESTETGWAYFLVNLRLYLETHQGRTRRMIWERIPVMAPREAAWKHIASAATGVAPAAVSGLAVGDRVRFAFDGGPTTDGVVELAVAAKGLAIRMAELDSVLFIELEGGAPDSFHTGWWLSVYDAGRAKELETPAKRTFARIHERIPRCPRSGVSLLTGPGAGEKLQGPQPSPPPCPTTSSTGS